MRAALACLALCVLPSTARAQDRFEIQVYESEINEPWRSSVILHANYTFSGEDSPAYPGEIPADGAARFTLEPALGLTEFLEVGAYFQTVAAPDFGFRYAGVKLRTMWVVPRRLSGDFDLGLNVELSNLPKVAEPEAWGMELRPILGWRSRWVGVWVNPILGWSLSGPAPVRPELTPAAKVSLDTQKGAAFGLEYYAGLGEFAEGFLPLADQTHLLFAAFDLVNAPGHEPSPWILNLALGVGLTSGTPQRSIVKAIVGRSLF